MTAVRWALGIGAAWVGLAWFGWRVMDAVGCDDWSEGSEL